MSFENNYQQQMGAPLISNREDITFSTEDLPRWQESAVKLIEYGVGKRKLMHMYSQFLSKNASPESFWDDVVASMQLSISAYAGGLANIPEKGPLVVVANHPFGLIDGAAICWLISQRRKDFKVILWDVFKKKNHGAKYFLPLDLSETCKKARRQNLNVRKTAINELRDDRAILIFPSGSVERSASLLGNPLELPWLPFAKKMITASDATVLPIFVHGHNSKLFHAASGVSETLRRALFFYEIKRKIGSEVELSIGAPVSNKALLKATEDQDITEWLHKETMALARYAVGKSINKTTLLSHNS